MSRPENKSPRIPQSKFLGYTPLALPREQVLMQIRNLDLLRKPKDIKTTPNRIDISKYCRCHRDHGHMLEDCFDLNEEIESLVQRGYLKEFVRKDGGRIEELYIHS